VTWSPQRAVDEAAFGLYRLTHPRRPWCTPEAIAWLEDHVRPTDVAIQWGAGPGTVWLARRVDHLTVIDHDPERYHRVSEWLRDINADNVDFHLYDVDDPQYVWHIRIFERGSLDLIVVGGLEKGRGPCAVAALSRLRVGGRFVVEDVQHYLPAHTRSPGAIGPNAEPTAKAWREFLQRVESWPVLYTSNGVTDTAVWARPHESYNDFTV
jgi:predicted O-methyltransferase YrrM